MLGVAEHVRNTKQMKRLLVVALAGLAAACSSSPKHYALRGQVLAKDDTQVTISHENVPGLMPAMTMPYSVKDPAEFQKLEPGDTITADLVVDREQKNWLEKVKIADRSGREARPSITADELDTGAAIPDVKLINQDGKTIHLSDFKGKAVLITFIYTRCPFADFCPLISHEFAALDRELAKTPGDYERTHLVSVSLDPAFDKPPVLRSYGLTYVKNFAHWDFVATEPADLKQLAKAFNLTYYEQGQQIVHNLRTVLLATDGAVARVWSGNEWRKQEIVEAVRTAAAGVYIQ